MAERRQSFRFRLPWRNRGSQVEPEPRPTAKTQNPAQTTATAPADRPPFRPAGKAPVKASPSQAQSPARTEPLPPSPSRTNEPQKTPGASTQTQLQVESFPPSPSRVASQPQAAPQVSTQTQSQPATTQESSQIPSLPAEPPSPASKPSRTEPLPPSPSRTIEPQKTSGAATQTRIQVESFPPSRVASQPQAASQVSPQTQSQPATTQESSQIPSLSAEPPSPASQQEPKEVISQPPLTEPQQNAEIVASETTSSAQSNTPRETTVQTRAASAEAVEAIASPEKVDHKHLPESETKSNDHKEGEKVVQALTKEEKTKDPGHRDSIQETVTQLHAAVTGSGKHSKDLLGVAFQAEHRHKKQETFERKETSASGKPMKTPKDGSTSRKSIQKTVSSTVEQALPHKETKKDVLQLDKLATDHQMLEQLVSVVTLTGENRGASMHLSSEPAREEESIHIHRSYNKINPDDSPEATSDGEVSNEGKLFKDQMSSEDQQTSPYINSNVQSINNAILFNSSVTEGNPGVQMVFSQNPAESSKSNGKSEPPKTHKAQFTGTPSEKLTHESTVRRRCLRGLFLEPSDSDPDNPEKPRRHGCHYNCGQKKKESEIGIL